MRQQLAAEKGKGGREQYLTSTPVGNCGGSTEMAAAGPIANGFETSKKSMEGELLGQRFLSATPSRSTPGYDDYVSRKKLDDSDQMAFEKYEQSEDAVSSILMSISSSISRNSKLDYSQTQRTTMKFQSPINCISITAKNSPPPKKNLS